MTREQAINYLISSGMSDEQIRTIVNAFTRDAVDRQTVINTLDFIDSVLDEDRTVENYKETLKACYEMLPSVVPQQNLRKEGNIMNEWISCKDRLPKPSEYLGDVNKYYLVQNEYGDMMVACYDGMWTQIYNRDYIEEEIVAWRELPKPYKAN